MNSKIVEESRGVVLVEMVKEKKKAGRMAEFREEKIEISSVMSSF